MSGRKYLLLAALLLVSCDKSLFPSPPRLFREHAAYTPTGSAPLPQEEDGPAIYASALVFPDEVDWKSGDRRFAYIHLYRNGQLVARVPAGNNPDPGAHRIIGGHLWSELVKEKETVVYRDGEERFRLDADEFILGIMPTEDGVYTLSQKPGGAGISFRRDGAVLYEDNAGVAVGSFNDREWEYGALQDGLYYAYSIPVKTGDAYLLEYRVMKANVPYKVLPAGMCGTVFDVKVEEGRVWRIEKRSPLITSTCLVKDDSYYTLGIYQGETPRNMRLVPGGLVKGSSNDGLNYWYRNEEGLVKSISSSIRDLYREGGSYAWCIENDGRIVAIMKNYGVLHRPEEGRYSLTSPRCADLHDGVFYVAATDMQSGENALFTDNQREVYSFNGYFTSLKVETHAGLEVEP